jgi:hypothetical protein
MDRSSAGRTPAEGHPRWRFLRDVLVFQIKLVLGNLQNLVLVPLSLGAAAIDLVFKGKHEGQLFYNVLRLGRYTDEAINIYSSIGGYRPTPGESEEGLSMKTDFSVDTVLSRLEGVIVREYEKGATAASLKGAVDRAIDHLQAQGDKGRNKIGSVVVKTRHRFRRSPAKPE